MTMHHSDVGRNPLEKAKIANISLRNTRHFQYKTNRKHELMSKFVAKFLDLAPIETDFPENWYSNVIFDAEAE